MKYYNLLIIIIISLFLSGCSSTNISILDPSAELDVNIQDQYTRPISLRMNQVIKTNITLATDTIVDSKTINLNSGHGLVIGDNIILLQENGEPQFYFGEVLNVVGNIITLDSLITYPFHANQTIITNYNPNLNQDGSTTPYIVELRNPFTIPIDINRLIFHITDNTAMDDGTFGGISSLTNGISFRKNVDVNNNQHFWNVKNNGQLKELTYDLSYDDKSPAGVYGVGSRLSYNGQDKHGVAIRLEQGQAIELIIQDDLTSLVSFYVVAEGHFTSGEEE